MASNRLRVLGVVIQHIDMERATEEGLRYAEALGGDLTDPPIQPADLGIDSSAFVSIKTKLEEEFGVQIPNEEAAKWQSVADMLVSLDR